MRTVAERLAGQAAVIEINIDENPRLASRFGVRSVPLIILLKQGKVLAELPGAGTPEAIIALARQHL